MILLEGFDIFAIASIKFTGKDVMYMPKKGDWVIIHTTILTKEQRAPQVPADTSQVPLEAWVKGYLQEDAQIGSEVTVKTASGRIEKGRLIEVNPTYRHSFGNFIPEILEIDRRLHEALYGGES